MKNYFTVILVIATVIYCKRREKRGLLNPEFVPLFKTNSMGISTPESSDYSSHLYVDLDG